MILALITAIAVEKAKATPFQMMVGLFATVLILSICTGCIIAWIQWRSGKGPKLLATGPMATVGLVDVIATIVILLGFGAVLTVAWQLAVKPWIGLPQSPAGQELVSQSEPSPSIAEPETETKPETEIKPETEAKPATEAKVGDLKSTAVPPKKITREQFLFSGFVFTAELICVLFVTAFVCARTGCSIQRLGWRTDRWQGDLWAGFQVYLMMTPVIFILNALLSNLTGVPYDHPIFEMIQTYPWLLGVAFWLVSIVAPVFEEFAFRTLLIGWFESIHIGKNKLAATAFGEAPSDHDSPPLGYSPPWWPAILSGVLFGLAHFSYGVSWVNLSILGIVLGRLYQIRQSLIPVMVVHCLFNSTSIVLLGLKLLLPGP
jgi:membrane protease YdiL (CAAX protease family)